jgi:uncharacterized protein
MSTPFHLYQLQKIDSHADNAKRRIQEILRLVNLDSKSDELATKLENIQIALEEQRKSAEHIVAEIGTRKIKLEQSNSALYGGKVQNPKELQDLQMEIELLKKSISGFEDELLLEMDVTEKTQLLESNAKSELDLSKSEFQRFVGILEKEKEGLSKNLERLIIERQVSSSQIKGEFLSIYESIRQKKKGIAVSIIKDQACSACGHELTPAEIQKTRTSNELCYCSSCNRILYSE